MRFTERSINYLIKTQTDQNSIKQIEKEERKKLKSGDNEDE